MSDYLPSELLISIFTRLPVETVVQCSLVCKSWNSLITNPTFISEHLKFNQTIAKDNPNLLVRRVLYTDPKKEIYTLHCDNESFDEYSKLNLSLKSVGSFFTIVGNCNGLLCLLDERNSSAPVKNIYLWNPMIRKSITLPKYKFFSSNVESTGFGFDHVTNDYKVIRIVHPSFPNFSSRVELYSLSTGEWRNISHVTFPKYEVYGHSQQANLNGAIHWLAHGGLNASVYLVILFDLHDEVFRVMKLPNSVNFP